MQEKCLMETADPTEDLGEFLPLLTPRKNHLDENEYDAEEVRAKAKHVRELSNGGLLALWAKGPDDHGNWYDFVVFEDSGDGLTVVLRGCGPGGTVADGGLRECRHTWWGPRGDGYIFYPNAKKIAEALHALQEWYDVDG